MKISGEITSQLARHAAMQQASGTGEVSGKSMAHDIYALTVGTKYEGTLDPTYAVRKARNENPAMFNPVMAKNDDDRRVEWLSYKNINDWTDMAKKELIQIKMVIDKPGLISKKLKVLCYAM